MIVKTKTTDQNGKIYDKIFMNEEIGAICCFNSKNRKLKVNPNFSIRHGDGKFGEEVVLQFLVHNILEEYNAKSPKDHIEAYFVIDKTTLELFEKITELIREKVNGKQ